MSIKKITEYPIAPNLGDENYLLGTVDGETKLIDPQVIIDKAIGDAIGGEY